MLSFFKGHCGAILRSVFLSCNKMSYLKHETDHQATSLHREIDWRILMIREMQEELKSMRLDLQNMQQKPNLVEDKKMQLPPPTAQKKETQQKRHEGFPELLDSAAVMQWLRISKRTLQNYRNQGVIPFIKFRGKILYNRKDIAALVKAQPNNRQAQPNNK